MSVGPVGGYSGVNGGRALSDVYAYEPGTSLSNRFNRYHDLVQEQEEHKPLAVLPQSLASDTQAMTTTTKPGDYKPPVRGGVQAGKLRRLPGERRFVAQSTSQSTFGDYMAEAKQWSSVTPDRIVAAFDTLDTDGSGSLEKGEVRMAMYEILQREPSDHEQRIFMAYLDTNRDGRIGRQEWEKGVQGAIKHLQSEGTVQLVKKDQPWKKRYPRERRVMSNLAMASSNMLDMGTYGSVPTSRPMLSSTGVLASTTNDLQEGTVKDTFHPPRYTGFVPQAGRTYAQEQSRGVVPRSSFDSKTNLTHTFHKRMPGFSGHVPTGNASMAIHRRQGVGAETDAAVANSLVEQYWAARASVVAKRAAAAAQ